MAAIYVGDQVALGPIGNQVLSGDQGVKVLSGNYDTTPLLETGHVLVN